MSRSMPLLIFLALYLLLFSFIESMDAPEYYLTYIDIDKMIPFCEIFVIPYFLWFIMLPAIGLYLLFKDEKEYKRMSYMLVFGMSAFIILSLFIPTKLYLRPYVLPRDNIFCDMVSFLYHIDTSTNVFPSIHVFNTLVAMQAVKRSSVGAFSGRCIRGIVYVNSILIILSTVFIKQHSLLDVFGGLIFFIIADKFVNVCAYSMKHEPAVERARHE
ncbi:MAG: serine/threonine protein phosphatase [Lachnospiraceae bacterium]|nr:serine/threonine protein phosphatase [Lachnospiraceae bacterium]